MTETMTDNTVNTGSISDEERERAYRKELLKKKDSAKGRKDKGYKMFEEEDSEEEPIIIDDVRSPSKMKKHSKPSFKFAKKEKYFKKDKEEKREKDIKKEEKKKEEKEAKKEKLKIGKDKKKTRSEADDADEAVHQIFGVPLAVAVDKSKCHDGIPLPAIFRECIDYVEEFGLICEGIYRISGVKSKVQALKDCYNRNQPGYLHEHEPNVVASLLKLYLRDLPEPVLTKQLTPKFEEASTLKNVKQKVETFQKLIEDLPAANRFLLSWTIVHMTHIIAMEKQNKMSLQNVSIVLSPTLQISHRVLNVLFTYSKILFTDVVIKKYVPPLRPVTSRWSLELPDSPTSLEEELRKQESLLAKLHEELIRVKDADKEEQVWEVQRVVTQLKRKLKLAKKQSESLKKGEQKQDPSGKPENRKPKEQEETHQAKQQSQQPKQRQHIHIKQPPVAHKQRLSQPFRRQILLPLVPQKVPIATTAAKVEDEEVKEEKTKEIIFRSVEELEEELKQVELETKKEAKNEQSAENAEQEEKETKEPDNKDEDEVCSTVEDKNEDKKNEEIKDEEKVPEPVVEDVAKEEPEVKPVNDVEEVVPVQEVEGDKETKQEVNTPSGEVSDEDTLEIKTPDEEVPQTIEEQYKSEEHTPEAEISDTNSSMVIDKTDEERASLEEEDEDEEVNEEEVAQLLLQEAELLLEEEELLAIRHELYKKIETEQNEIERLHQEMADIRSIRDDVYTDSSCSDSSDESGEEWELEDILTNLRQQNGRLERENQELCEKVHQERQICLEVKVQIRMIQQGHLDSAAGMEEEKEGILVQL